MTFALACLLPFQANLKRSKKLSQELQEIVNRKNKSSSSGINGNLNLLSMSSESQDGVGTGPGAPPAAVVHAAGEGERGPPKILTTSDRSKSASSLMRLTRPGKADIFKRPKSERLASNPSHKLIVGDPAPSSSRFRDRPKGRSFSSTSSSPPPSPQKTEAKKRSSFLSTISTRLGLSSSPDGARKPREALSSPEVYATSGSDDELELDLSKLNLSMLRTLSGSNLNPHNPSSTPATESLCGSQSSGSLGDMHSDVSNVALECVDDLRVRLPSH